MAVSTPDLKEMEDQLNELRQGFDTLLMATVNEGGFPEASYAAYVEYGDSFYIFISELASHTNNLKRSGTASLMFIENEADADHAFGRKRLTYRCDAAEVMLDEERFEPVLQLMEERFGRLIATLRGLKDFQLFQIKPQSGQFVAGFGKAFEIDYSQGEKHRHQRHV